MFQQDVTATKDETKGVEAADAQENREDALERERKEQENSIVPKFSMAFKAGLAALASSHDEVTEEPPERDEDDEDEDE